MSHNSNSNSNSNSNGDGSGSHDAVASYMFEPSGINEVTIKVLDDGLWKIKGIVSAEAVVFDGLNNTVTITENKGAYNEVKTFTLDVANNVYTLSSETFTDPNGVPITAEPHDVLDDKNHDGFDDNDIDHDGFSDDHLSVSDGNHSLHGHGGDDILDGSAGDDSLDGGEGDDDLNGGSGKDKLSGGHGNDDLAGGEGDDSLSGDDGADHIRGGGGDDNLKGGKGDDDLDAGSGDDSVDAGSGDDSIQAGLDGGNDRYNGGSGDDTVSYTGALAGVSVNLDRGLAKSLVNDDSATGVDKIRNVENITGSEFNDVLIGNHGVNQLDGGNGNDVLIGGGKADILTGGLGDDTFRFLKVSDSKVGAADTITDFSDGDLIDLSAIDATKGLGKNDSFHFVSDPATVDASNANGAVWFENGVLFASTDGDVQAEFQLQLTGVTSLTEASLLL